MINKNEWTSYQNHHSVSVLLITDFTHLTQVPLTPQMRDQFNLYIMSNSCFVLIFKDSSATLVSGTGENTYLHRRYSQEVSLISFGYGNTKIVLQRGFQPLSTLTSKDSNLIFQITGKLD